MRPRRSAEQRLQADTQAEVAALQAKAASSPAAAQADLNNANTAYAQIVALNQMAIAHQMPRWQRDVSRFQ